MRKIVYSGITKFIAAVLFIASIVSGVLTATDGVLAYCNQEKEIYGFESDFSESWYISNLLNDPEHVVFNAYHSVFYIDNGKGYPRIKGNIESEELRLALAQNLKERFSADYYYSDTINYYVQWNELVLTNCGAESAEDLMQGEYYSYLKRNAGGYVERETSGNRSMSRPYLLEEIVIYDNTSTIIIGCSVKEEAVAEYKALWELQEGIVIRAFAQTGICAVAAVVLLIYLICVCGKTAAGEYKNLWLDNVWLEGHLAAVAAFGTGGVALCFLVIDQYAYGDFPISLLYPILGSASGLVSLILITSLLSVIRNIKTRKLIETSIILRILRWIVRLFIGIVRWLWRVTRTFWRAIFAMVSKRAGVLLIAILFVYTGITGLFGVLTVISPAWLLLGIPLFGGICFVAACRGKDLDAIKKGASEVRNGNVAYKIPQVRCRDMQALAMNINDIAQGLDESVAAKVKAERLKTELITNVSHDIKTPITSIISYTELLSKVENMPEEARDYVAVIAKKSDRLKNLTQDLFDISRVQSGNDEVILEKLDVSLLIHQALAEHDNEIQNSGLPFCVDTPKELFISADGRKMSRVVGNLINNILKYTMKNTRVFIAASEKDGMIVMEFKNISAYPLNFNAEEITQRFVRGDEARTAEGNGLGLAIAKSYTEICNGTLEIVADGDMFKAILKFRKYT